MKQDTLHTPIFVTGIERSGSTIVAKILRLCGAFAGDVSEMSENKAIKKLVDSYYVDRLHLPQNGQKPLPITKDLITPKFWGANVEHSLYKDGYSGSGPWMYKSSRIAQIWPVWNTVYPNAKWIIVRRRTGDIVYSCMKTSYMSAYKDTSGWLEWVHLHEKLFVDMIETGLNCKVIWPERMVSGDYQQIYEMLEWLGLPWNDQIVNLVTPLLRNSTLKERSI